MITTSELTKRFPFARFYPEWRLMTWNPTGVLDDKSADLVIEFMQLAEKAEPEPFNRFIDSTGFSSVEIGLAHVVRMARLRRRYRGPRVKSALHAVGPTSRKIAQLYAELMGGSRIEVRTFTARTEAAEWLGVPKQILLPPRQ
jgi:hypothetical protein